MKTKLAAIFGASFTLAFLIVAAEDKSSQAPGKQSAVANAQSAQTPASTNFLVLGYIETQARTITIKSGPKGRVYSVKTSDGKVLCENASLEELRAKAPELHDFVKTGIAKGEKGAGSTLDARVMSSVLR
jgi:hypothetical protein